MAESGEMFHRKDLKPERPVVAIACPDEGGADGICEETKPIAKKIR